MSLSRFNLSFLLLGLMTSFSYAEDRVAKIAQSYLTNVASAQNFTHPFEMMYDVDIEYPIVPATEHAIAAKYHHWVKQPLFRYEASIGPYKPSNQEPVKYESFWNGASEVTIQSDDTNSQSSIVVGRRETVNDYARSNKYLWLLGIPGTARELEESRNGSYFLASSVNENNGYKISTETERVGSEACEVIRKQGMDSIWFSMSEPRRILKRDFWHVEASVTRMVIDLIEFDENGFPCQMRLTTFQPVAAIGDESLVRSVQTFTLKFLSFHVPDEDLFIAKAEVGASVVDQASLASFRIEPEGKPPFDKFLKNATAITITSGSYNSYIFMGLFAICVLTIAGNFFLRRKS